MTGNTPAAWAGPIVLVIGYIAGSLPWGYWFGRWFHGIDVRTVGSGGTGATNVARSMGWPTSVAVLVLDLLKGAAPVLFGRALGVNEWWIAAAAVAAVIGHCWSPWIGFTGGKGVATAGGAAIALYPPVALALPVMLVIVWLTRYVSLASIVGCLLATVATAILALAGRLEPAIPVAIGLMTVIIVYRHRANIERLRAGTERRFGDRVKTA